MENKTITRPDVIFATLDEVKKLDKTHFSLVFFKYSRLDEILENLEKWKGKDIRMYISILPPKPEVVEKQHTNEMLTNVFWDIETMIEE